MQIATSVDDLALSRDACVTIGNFDGVHLGHQTLISHALAAARQRNLDAVLVTFWPHPRMVLSPERGHKPLSTRQERLDLLAALGVERVLELPFTRELALLNPEEFVRHCLQPLGMRHLVVGHDFTLGRARSGTASVLLALGQSLGFNVEQVAALVVDGVVVSSTHLRELISQGEVGAAARLLGRDYAFAGEVIHGDGRGEGLGFPTANLLPPQALCPAQGVYATRVALNGRRWQAVTNIGHRPTFGGQDVSVESFLLDACENLYGQVIRLEFAARLRGEQRFDSVDALKAQIGCDVASARRILA